MVAGNVVDRLPPFSTITHVGWHRCIIKASTVLYIFMVSAYPWFQDRGNRHKWRSNASKYMKLICCVLRE